MRKLLVTKIPRARCCDTQGIAISFAVTVKFHHTSADFSTCRHFFFRYHQGQISIRIFGAEDHSFTEDSCKFGRFQICNNHNFLANHFFCTVVRFDAGYDLAYLTADFYLVLVLIFLYAPIAVMMVLSFLLALLLNRNFKGIGVFRVLIYLPVVIPVTVSGIIWRNFTEVDFGLANAFLEALGLPRFTFFDAADTSMFSLIFFNLWGLGGGMILWLSALKNVPPALYEAAEIDGAGRGRRLISITIPMCTPMIFYNLIMNIIGSLQTFGSVYTLTGGSTGEENSLLFYLMKVYNDAFNFQGKTMGYACAESWVLFLIIAALTAVVFKTSKWVFYGEDAQ